jgi:hypothetical protein
MRHFFGLILALAMSAALFFGAGLGVWRISSLTASGAGVGWSGLVSTANLAPLAALLGAGLLLAILLLVPRTSPLSTGLPGLVALGWSGWLVARGKHALTYVPMADSHYAAGFALMLNSGALALIGVVMIIPLFVPSRWRRAESEVDDYNDEDIDVPSELGLVP